MLLILALSLVEQTGLAYSKVCKGHLFDFFLFHPRVSFESDFSVILILDQYRPGVQTKGDWQLGSKIPVPTQTVPGRLPRSADRESQD